MQPLPLTGTESDIQPVSSGPFSDIKNKAEQASGPAQSYTPKMSIMTGEEYAKASDKVRHFRPEVTEVATKAESVAGLSAGESASAAFKTGVIATGGEAKWNALTAATKAIPEGVGWGVGFAGASIAVDAAKGIYQSAQTQGSIGEHLIRGGGASAKSPDLSSILSALNRISGLQSRM